MLLDQGFTDEFIEQFSNQGFYASPNRTKINIFLDGQQWLVGNAIVANIEQTNEKIPVYSYNSPNYSKYLNGREVVTGTIGLRKITVAQFIKMIAIDKKNIELTNRIEELTEELKKLENIVDKNGVKLEASGIKKMILDKQATIKRYTEIIEKSTGKDAVLYQMENYLNGDKDIFPDDDLLYYLDNKTGGENRLKILINFEGSGSEVCPFIALKDVLFIKKQTEINVGRGDVIEFYTFIGNPSYNKEIKNV